MNTSKVVMANTNAQYLLADSGHLDKHYYTETLSSNIDALKKKCRKCLWGRQKLYSIRIFFF